MTAIEVTRSLCDLYRRLREMEARHREELRDLNGDITALELEASHMPELDRHDLACWSCGGTGGEFENGTGLVCSRCIGTGLEPPE